MKKKEEGGKGGGGGWGGGCGSGSSDNDDDSEQLYNDLDEFAIGYKITTRVVEHEFIVSAEQRFVTSDFRWLDIMQFCTKNQKNVYYTDNWKGATYWNKNC